MAEKKTPLTTDKSSKSGIMLEIKNLQKTFGTKEVLKNMNLQVKDGESLVVIGGSGSGKSVFLKCILGLMDPTSGHVFIDGEETTHLHGRDRLEVMKKFGMLFQGGALFDSLTVWENVSFVMLEQGEKRALARTHAIEQLARVGLEERVADLRPSELSGGMQKRVALARAVSHKPKIIFYDEPTTGLDPITSDVINNLIIQLREDLGVTSITITHDMTSAYKIADRMAMLYKGEMIAQGTVDDIRHSKNPYVDQFIHGRAEGPIESVTNAYKVL